ncbi:MAG: exosome complex protein Rrp42 [Candidatus Methylarchaceae archaeon HK01B]|nr:exosome complex protein Rrp42 [Candidatus Methylarchaceae archaeon HK01M]MCP8312702.1 exosome complex protein Rrp42 [Candidatus Methylarchaceae archaeon HK02M1]MCP8319163.1 exosome complex protein Rrp42 [Candidatus Methylarchaceae archaeon HK01B]
MSAVKKAVVVERLRKAQIVEFLSKGKRLDGRGLLDFRPIKIETGIIEKANGSARVQIGNTQVIAGVKIEIGEPFPDTPEMGLLVVNVEVLPLSSAYAEPGPPDEEAIELARVVDRGIRESKMVDLSKLVLISGKKVHALFVDVDILDTDGNLFDAASYATVASIATSTMPKSSVGQDGQIKQEDESIPLQINCIPISITLAKIDSEFIVDPTSEEEAVMDARITFTFDDDGKIRAGQKGQPGTLDFNQVKLAVEIAKAKAKEIREIIKKSIKDAKG